MSEGGSESARVRACVRACVRAWVRGVCLQYELLYHRQIAANKTCENMRDYQNRVEGVA